MASGSLRLHFRTLATPDISLSMMFEAIQQVYALANIQVRLASSRALELPQLRTVKVGKCESDLTDDERALHAHREGALENDVIAFICEMLDPPIDGCSVHPPGQPGVVIWRRAPSPYTLAHEVGHVLGLVHVDDDDSLMTGNGPENITNLPPDLSADEIAIMNRSPLVQRISAGEKRVRGLLESHTPFESKLDQLPEDGHEILASLADSDDARIAAKAVYLASLQGGERAGAILTGALDHPLPEIRSIAEQSLDNLPAARARALRSRSARPKVTRMRAKPKPKKRRRAAKRPTKRR
jgi:hypothetical protein